MSYLLCRKQTAAAAVSPYVMMLQGNQQAPIVIISAIIVAMVVGIDSVPDITLFAPPHRNTTRNSIRQLFGQDSTKLETLFKSTRAYREKTSLQEKAMPCCKSASCSGEEGFYRPTRSSSITAFHRSGTRRMYHELVEKLLEGINPMVPPVSDSLAPVNMSMEMIIESVLQLDIRSQTFTIAVWFQVGTLFIVCFFWL